MPKDEKGKYTFEEWDYLLPKFSSEFASRHVDATVFVFSSYETFTRVLDDPEKYGFDAADKSKQGGTIWCDHAHPTSKMHDEIAKDLIVFLSNVKAEK